MRLKIEEEIKSIKPLDDLEKRHINEALEWIHSGAELCRIEKPDVPPQHLVSYFVVVDEDHVLLVDHKNAQLWLPTGGHVEPGEHPQKTVRREALEELNINANFLFNQPIMLTSRETGGLTPGHIDVSLWYVLTSSRQLSMNYDRNEFHDVQWFHIDNIPFERSDPYMQRFIKKLF